MGNRIAKLRHMRGLSQAALAKVLGLSTSTIAMYEQGRREPSVSIIIALAGVLGVTIDYLLTGQPPRQTTLASEMDNTHARLIATILSAARCIGRNYE